MINENWELRIGQISPEILDTKLRCPGSEDHAVRVEVLLLNSNLTVSGFWRLNATIFVANRNNRN
ncbi:MAG: hypothetical protein DMG14_00070 [Acidobacteria bacterium]|nr:MAG: hypothetical protein DMG14_00070 [Acidobacteriota bacterium]